MLTITMNLNAFL